jgi:hypothetical protein
LETGQRLEQRREARRPADGEVVFRFGDARKEVRARLVDRSESGLRIEHDSPDLTSGQLVEFRIGATQQRAARVIWTRILEGRVESGFLILP